MSLINKVLRDLDQRSALSAPDSAPPPNQVKPVAKGKGGREWFWRIVAALMLAALGWVAWIAYQLQPRPVATELAYQAAEQARQKAQAPATKPKPIAQKPVAEAPKPPAPAPAGKPPATASAPEVLKLAQAIETPIPERAEPAAPKPAAGPKPATQAPARPAAPASAPSASAHVASGKLEKHEQPRTGPERAEMEFRRGTSLLSQGRMSEAESALRAALALDPAHEAVRQTLVSLYLEERRIPEASRLLQEGLALNPHQVRFATVLARVSVERGDYAGALEILDRVRTAAGPDGEFNSLRGGVLQRLSRHAEAADAYRAAVSAGPQNGVSWVGLGISLEALQRRSEAADAFRRAVATGTLTAEVKNYAEQRARALR